MTHHNEGMVGTRDLLKPNARGQMLLNEIVYNKPKVIIHGKNLLTIIFLKSGEIKHTFFIHQILFFFKKFTLLQIGTVNRG